MQLRGSLGLMNGHSLNLIFSLSLFFKINLRCLSCVCCEIVAVARFCLLLIFQQTCSYLPCRKTSPTLLLFLYCCLPQINYTNIHIHKSYTSVRTLKRQSECIALHEESVALPNLTWAQTEFLNAC